MEIYVVKNGDTLYGIARRFASSVDDIVFANQLQNPELLSVGQALVIPTSERRHTVRRGETLYGIARSYGVSPERLIAAKAQELGLTELNEEDLARINASIDAANVAAVRKDWATVVRQKSDAINVILKSNFAQDAEFVALKKQLQDQINDHQRELSATERARDLEARGIDYILKNFSNSKKEHLSQPQREQGL